MKRIVLALVLCIAATVHAENTPRDPLAGIRFLVGHWRSDDGKVADTGGTSKGSSTITLEANGQALLRRDHTELYDAKGKPSGSFDQIMLIYLENGGVSADYTDGQHVIHYRATASVAGRSVTFSSVVPPGAPVFRLSYDLQNNGVLDVGFGMTAPGRGAFHPIAHGTMRKTG